jgi:hypothetical protein
MISGRPSSLRAQRLGQRDAGSAVGNEQLHDVRVRRGNSINDGRVIDRVQRHPVFADNFSAERREMLFERLLIFLSDNKVGDRDIGVAYAVLVGKVRLAGDGLRHRTGRPNEIKALLIRSDDPLKTTGTFASGNTAPQRPPATNSSHQ